MSELAQENEDLKAEIAELRAELEELRAEMDLDAAHAAGLSAQLRAIIAEGRACSCKEAHPLLETCEFVNDMTGATMTKTKSYPLYREAFDEVAREAGFDMPHTKRA